jgi:hypothetical protein
MLIKQVDMALMSIANCSAGMIWEMRWWNNRMHLQFCFVPEKIDWKFNYTQPFSDFDNCPFGEWVNQVAQLRKEMNPLTVALHHGEYLLLNNT